MANSIIALPYQEFLQGDRTFQASVVNLSTSDRIAEDKI
jgi:hypothetical protein